MNLAGKLFDCLRARKLMDLSTLRNNYYSSKTVYKQMLREGVKKH